MNTVQEAVIAWIEERLRMLYALRPKFEGSLS